MARDILRFVRGTAAQNANYTGAVGEPVLINDTGGLAVHDGATPGGLPMQRADLLDIAPVKPRAGARSRALADWFADTKNAAAYITDGDAGIAQAINRATLAAGGTGAVRVPPGIYANPGDILIKEAGRVTNGASGRLVVDMRGVIFTGTGNLVIDSSKRVILVGLDAKGYRLSCRGLWWSRIIDCEFDEIAFGDVAGNSFTSCYWNVFDNVGCSFMRFVGETNANTLRSPTFRGDAQQGWLTARPYAFEFEGNANVQALRVIGGDISYYSDGIYRIGAANTTADIDLTFDGGTYFDTVVPQPPTVRRNVRVCGRNPFYAQPKALTGASLVAASRDDQEAWSSTVTMGWRSTAAINLIPNGDLVSKQTSYVGTNAPLSGAAGCTITEQTGAGLAGRYLNVNKTVVTDPSIYFQVAKVPVSGVYAGAFVARVGGGVGAARDFQFAINGENFVRSIGPDWQLITIGVSTALDAGAAFNMLLLAADRAAFSLDIAYVGVTLGNRPPLMARCLPQPPLQGTTAVPAQTLQPNTFSGVYFISVPGSKVGDFVTLSYDKPLSIMRLLGTVEADGQVQCIINNPYGNARSIEAGTITARVDPLLR